MFKLFKPLLNNFPLIANCYRYVRDYRELNKDVKYRNILGFFFNGPKAMEEGTFEPQETFIFEKVIHRFDMFINIGANTGYYVCKALKCGTDVVAFEPNQLNVNFMLKNIEANNFINTFQLFPIALSNKLGVMPIFGASTGASLVEGWADQYNKNLTPISTFDKTAKSLIIDKDCFILIDIEGAELDCLKGAETLLKSDANHLFLIEISIGEHQPHGVEINPNLLETFELMDSFGYVAFTADKELRKIHLSEVKEVAESHIDSLGVHNFLFLKQENFLNNLNLR
jgi:FkbM family methyltransferase